MKLHFNILKGVSRSLKAPDRGNHSDEIHVWSHTIHYDDPFLRESPYLLSEEETAKAQKYHFEKDRRVYQSGHVFIRKVLSHYTSIEASQLELSPIVNHKPQLLNTPFPVHFNISHSGSKILVAVGFNSDVGIDIEKIAADFDMDGFAEANYHENEISKFRELNGDDETDYFYTVWTRKEAWLKLTGEGINDKLRKLDFSGNNKSPDISPHGHHDLYMTSWKESEEYMATLAAYSDNRKISFYLSDSLIDDVLND